MALTYAPTQIDIPLGGIELKGHLSVPDTAGGLVIFAHGSGSSRMSPRNRLVAARLVEAGLGTLLFDLLTEDEERIDIRTAELRFDIPFLAKRLVGVTDWTREQEQLRRLSVGYFGASTGAAAALMAAAKRPEVVRAVVSRGGRPDLAEATLPEVRAATLLIVGALDVPVIRMNETAFQQLGGVRQIEIVPEATHLFEEAGKLEEVAELARQWFQRRL